MRVRVMLDSATSAVVLNAATLAYWRAHPVEFIETILYDPETSTPFKLLPAERAFLEHAFKLRDDGKLLYPELIYSCPKKSGKTTLAAIFVITLLLLFGDALPEAVIAANSYEQTVARVFMMIRRIIEASPLLRGEAKITEAKITIAGATVTAIPSDAASAAGSNQNVACFDELWAYQTERAHRLFDELVWPQTRKIACRLTVTYAGYEGESALLESLYKRGMAQPEVARNLHAGDGILMAWHHEPVAPWQDEQWLVDMRRTLRPNQYLRMIENRFVSSEATFIEPSAWDRCVLPTLRPETSNRLLPVWIGVDASVKHDSSAIVAVTFDANTQMVRLVYHRIFQPSPDDPLDFERTIEATLLDLKKRFLVRKVLFDPYQMAATSQRLAKSGMVIQEFAQSQPNLTAASQQLYELIQGQGIVAYPDAAMRLAMTRTIALETSRGWRIGKDKQSNKIDVVIALAMACYAAVQGQGEPVFLPWELWI